MIFERRSSDDFVMSVFTGVLNIIMRISDLFDRQITPWKGEAYHGSAYEIDQFRVDHGVRPINIKSSDVGQVVFFTTDEEAAEGAARLAAKAKLHRTNPEEAKRRREAGEDRTDDAVIYKVQINLRRAYNDYASFTVEDKAATIAKAKSKNCDGVVFHNAREVGYHTYSRITCTTIAVFNPEKTVKMDGKVVSPSIR